MKSQKIGYSKINQKNLHSRLIEMMQNTLVNFAQGMGRQIEPTNLMVNQVITSEDFCGDEGAIRVVGKFVENVTFGNIQSPYVFIPRRHNSRTHKSNFKNPLNSPANKLICNILINLKLP